ncbi:MAG: GMC family oxidoreductase [Steroidobacteraceae bacterium]
MTSGEGDLTTDVLVIGAGASGAIASTYLIQQGIQVLCLEQGEWPDASKFVGRRAERELIAHPRFSPNPNVRQGEADYPVEATESDVDPVMYNAVGGSTVLWTGFWHRLLPSDFRVRSLDGVAADWPLSYDELAPEYDEVEAAVGVSGLAGDPAYPPRGPYPLPPFPLGRMGMRFVEGMNRLGWHWWPGTNAIPSRPYRRLNACVRRGTCITGCADGAKASMDITHWPDAIAAGARLITGARVREITIDPAGRANGAVYVDRAGRECRVRASVVVMCANGIGTPRLLLLSQSGRFPKGLANSSGLVGRGLMLHPTALASGVVDEPMETWLGPMGQTVNSMQFYETDRSRGFVRGSKWSLAPNGGPLGIAAALPVHGAELQHAMRATYGHMLTIAVFAEDLPEENNQVTLDDELTDSDGIPAPRIRYRVGENTRKLIDFNLARAREALEAAGTKSVFTLPVQRDFGGAHLMGSARMGNDPERSVVDKWGRCHDVPNLYIFDASVFVTSGAVNPTGTICALALRFARQLARERHSIRGAA